MNNTPKISVVMTVFNGGRFLREAVDSILNQTLGDFEFIIVDNASSDDTRQIIASYSDPRMILIENKENLGQTKALNIGIKRAKGEFIARMDADDVSLPQRLQLQYDYLQKNSDIAVVGSWHQEIDEQGRHIKYFKLPLDPFQIKCFLVSPGSLSYYCLSHPTVLMRHDVLSQVGLYDERFRTQDYELWVRVARKYNIANIGQYLVKHRRFQRQQSNEFKAQIEDECGRIVRNNISYYLPQLPEKEAVLLARMLLGKPQACPADGLKALETFRLFFRQYLGGEYQCGQAGLPAGQAGAIEAGLELFYLPQLAKTNPGYAAASGLRLLAAYPELLCCGKLYRKIAKSFFLN